MQIVILGSGSPIPDPNRAGPATVLRTSAGDLLFDCGRGVLMRGAAAGVGAPGLRGLFLTHLHSDHITDLNDIITMRWAMTFAPTPMPIMGPIGTESVVRKTESMLDLDIGYRLAHHDDLNWRPDDPVTEITDGVVFEEAEVRITAAPTDHAPVHPTVGYRVEDGDRTVVIAGDTVPCAGLDSLCQGADVLVHTVVRQDIIEALGVPRLIDVLDYHSSVQQAAETAARNGVKTLVLTHLVPAPQPTDEDEKPWIEQAAAHFDGTTVAARDLMTLDV